ncbi:MAG: hypothetical protein ACE5HI_03035 [bacterium]
MRAGELAGGEMQDELRRVWDESIFKKENLRFELRATLGKGARILDGVASRYFINCLRMAKLVGIPIGIGFFWLWLIVVGSSDLFEGLIGYVLAYAAWLLVFFKLRAFCMKRHGW